MISQPLHPRNSAGQPIVRGPGKPPRLPDAQGRWYCHGCRQWLPREHFTQRSDSDRPKSECRACHRRRVSPPDAPRERQPIDREFFAAFRDLHRDAAAKGQKFRARLLSAIRADLNHCGAGVPTGEPDDSILAALWEAS